MAAPTPRIFTIPSSALFLPTLIKALVEGRLLPDFRLDRDPLTLARATLYLPTRRACRLARDVFLDVLAGEAAILPRITAIGDVDEDEIAFAGAASGALAAHALGLPPAFGGQERKLMLTQLILKWSSLIVPTKGAPLVASNPATALALASDLARLLDDMATRQVSWDRLDDLVPDDMDKYWELTLNFLKVAREEWPGILNTHGAIEPAQRRDLLIAAEAGRLKQSNDGPVIVAGSTGSMPSTAMLLATIAKLPQGAVVLPGLDTDLDEKSWQLIAGDVGTPPPTDIRNLPCRLCFGASASNGKWCAFLASRRSMVGSRYCLKPYGRQQPPSIGRRNSRTALLKPTRIRRWPVWR